MTIAPKRRGSYSLLTLFVVVTVFSLGSSIALATEQVKDRLSYGGHEYVIFEVPMLGLWHTGDGEPPKSKFRPPALEVTSSANWTGYRATWEIRDKKLMLRTIRGRIKGKDVQNEAILPDMKFPVDATWFSGKIHLYVGDWNEEEHQYEAVIVFEIDKGNVKSMSFSPSTQINWSWNGL